MSEHDEIPGTVEEMLDGMAAIDQEALTNAGAGIGAVYNGILAETGDREIAVQLAATWTMAMVNGMTQ